MLSTEPGVDADFRAAILADPPSAWLPPLARKVVSVAIARDRDPPKMADRFLVELGADDYVHFLLAVRDCGVPAVPGDDFDWHGALVRACESLGLSGGDRAHVLGELTRLGWRSVALWGQVSAPQPQTSADVLARLGCRHFAMGCLWLRDRRPGSFPLTAYAVAS